MVNGKALLVLLLILGCGGGHRSGETPAPAPALLTPRSSGHTATRLRDGRVLVVGGLVPGPDGHLATTAAAELVDPGSGRVAATGPLAQARTNHSATLLGDGRVLIAGGAPRQGAVIALATAELYDPGAGAFRPAAGSLAFARHSHTATALPDGSVLLLGGDGAAPDQTLGSGERFDPGTGTFRLLASTMAPRTQHVAYALASGQVLIAGGVDWNRGVAPAATLFDPASLAFLPLATQLPATRSSARLLAGGLPSGRVLLVGQDFAATFDPATGRFGPARVPALPRRDAAAVTLKASGTLLVGGADPGGGPPALIPRMEQFQENTLAFGAAGCLRRPRRLHSATLLGDGRVLVLGGLDQDGQPLAECELLTVGQ